jgi:predicted N-formylglutamate amidohydrolase
VPEPVLLISCEHAVNHVPTRFHGLFKGHEAVLKSHRGYDSGALELAEYLAGGLHAPCFKGQITRLLIDHNRSPHNRALWSEFSRHLDTDDKEWLLDSYYRPFRALVSAWIATRNGAGESVMHLGIHSFTPVLDGKPRTTDIGILYDPQRVEEKTFARLLQRALQSARPDLRVRMNDPYRGVHDGHQSGYRRQYAADRYLAIELEINQLQVAGAAESWQALQRVVMLSLRTALAAGD